MNYFDLYNVIGICGGAWGDEGKGKFTDFFARQADIIVRAQGGNNAGHTVKAAGHTLKLHVVPSGIIYNDKINIIGNGVVLDIFSFVDKEISQLEDNDISTSNLFISPESHLIMPYHRIMDYIKSFGRIGTTGKGIGPCYSDKVNRIGIRVQDIMNKDIFIKKLAENIEHYNFLFSISDDISTIIDDFKINNPIFNDIFIDDKMDANKLFDVIKPYKDIVAEYVKDTRKIIADAVYNGKKILLEGAQGLLLDIDHGTYPYVTSSNSHAGGLSTGTGISPEKIDKIFSVTGAYLTRVGNGPLSGELGTWELIKDEKGTERLSFAECKELVKNDNSDYAKGKAIRHIAGEFGTTTGRPRRVGWLDLCVLDYIRENNGADIIITKFDVLDILPQVKVIKNYRYIGEIDFVLNGQTIKKNDIINRLPIESHVLENLVVNDFIVFDGWLSDTSKIRVYKDLPEKARIFLETLEKLSKVNIRILSVGPDRENTISIK
ncbi:MAG: adenylosuccinate synthase [Candidatus Muirbacterium halophilum]|nr:adenylosuccinate synthase [Candidatus Muirbacterium halophilum]MCK9476209.1 adenylosuccinate synthase [Candidatus Muirbacterium halophilum]